MSSLRARWVGLALALAGGPALFSGCTSKAAKQALNKPAPEAAYADFTKLVGKESERRAPKTEAIADDLAPEKAVDLLVDHMQRQEPAYFIPAEAQLRYWGTKQGVPEIIVQKVRQLLKNPRIEVRAPALRLTCTYGRRESLGDLIEVLGDDDYGMRKLASDSLRTRAGMDMGYHPAEGEVARKAALEAWRRWWQDERRAALASKGPPPKLEQPAPPMVITPGTAIEQAVAPIVPAPRDEVLPPPKNQDKSN